MVVPKWPEIFTDVAAETTLVLIVNVADEEPAATVTEAGTVALADVDESFTTDPPEGAIPERVTVPVEGVPPATVAGSSETDTSDTG